MGEHYTHLDIRERAMVEMNLALGKRPAQIAVYLSRSRSQRSAFSQRYPPAAILLWAWFVIRRMPSRCAPSPA